MLGDHELVDIAEENLHCHHLLFIKNVTDSTFDASKDCFKTVSNMLSFRRAKLNGIIVAQKSLLSDNNNEQEYSIWLDDGTSVIKAILPKRVLARADADLLVPSTNVTIFGKVEFINNEHVIQCGGFRVEDNDAAELYHWLRVIQERPKNKHTKNEPQQQMFYSMSSLPSPNRLLDENFLQSPIRVINSQNAGFLWSPDHTFATSTPIRAVQESSSNINISPLRNSPLRYRSIPKNMSQQQQDEDEDEDEFGDFGSSVDLIALENDALLMNNSNKRRFDLLANMD